MKKFLDIYRNNNCNFYKAAKSLKIPVPTVHNWMDNVPWFKAELEKILDEIFSDAQSTVFKQRKKVGGAQWLLMNHQKGRELGFGNRVQVEEKKELTLTMRLQVEKLKETYTKDELEQLYQLLKKAPGQHVRQLAEKNGTGDESSTDYDGGVGDVRVVSGNIH